MGVFHQIPYRVESVLSCLSFAPLVSSYLFHTGQVYPNALGGGVRIALRLACLLIVVRSQVPGRSESST